MKKSISDHELREAHTVFTEDHVRLRSELIASLPTSGPVTTLPARTARRFVWKFAMVTACVVIALVGWLEFAGVGSRRAFALDGIHERLLQIRSLHVKGTRYQIDDVDGKEIETAYPVESYAERSSRFFSRTSGTEVDGKEIRVKHGTFACDGGRIFGVWESDRRALRGNVDRFSTELRVESFLQNQLMQQIISGPTASYQLIGTEKVRNREALKYEYVDSHGGKRTRRIIWISSATGLPVQCATFEIDKTGRERRSTFLETIEINTPPPDGMFAFECPEGYDVVETADQSVDFGTVSAGAIQDSAADRYPFAIDHVAVLVCWHHHVTGVPETATNEPIVTPQAELHGSTEIRKCNLFPLRIQVENGSVWRFSLAIPVDHRPIDSDETIKLEFKYPSGSNSSFENYPLRLDDARLKYALDRMRELGTATGEAQPEMSLVRLRWLAMRYVTGNTTDE